jgi:bacteriorhodopsin
MGYTVREKMKLPQQLEDVDDDDVLDGSSPKQGLFCAASENEVSPSLENLKLPHELDDHGIMDRSASPRAPDEEKSPSLASPERSRSRLEDEDDRDQAYVRRGSKDSTASKASLNSRASNASVRVVLETIVEQRRSEITMLDELDKNRWIYRFAHKVEYAAMILFGVASTSMLVLWEVHEHPESFVTTFFVTAIAGLTYLTKATIGDFMFKGTKVPVARYFDWITTTPLMLYELCHLGHAPQHTSIMIIGCDILMLVCGIVSALISWEHKGLKHVWFLIACVLYVVWVHCLHVDVGNGSALEQPEKIQRLFQQLEVLTIVTWSGFPVTVLLGRAHFKVITRPMEDILLTCLDVTSKIGMEGLLLFTCVSGCTYTEDH